MIRVADLKKDKSLYEVQFENGVALKVDEDFVVKYRLVKNKEIDDAIYKEIIKEASYNSYKNKLIRYASTYLKSRYQYSLYLKKISTPTWAIDLILDELQESKIINDEFYAKSLIEHYLNLGYGEKYIEYKLKESRVESEIINNCVYSISDEIYKESIRKYLKKNNKKDIKALTRALLNRGFNYQLINECLNSI